MITLSMMEVPGGVFEMGGRPDDKFVSGVELPRRTVKMEGFRISATVVTRGEWVAVMKSLPAGNEGGLDDGFPVVGVTFAEAENFCEALGDGARLPSEAEWEYGCRGGGDGVFPCGDLLNEADANFSYDELGGKVGRGKLMKVRSFPANGFGLFEMAGNVCEWVFDRWHSSYLHAPCRGEAWLDGGAEGRRVIRGGGWDHLPRVLRASWRDWAPEGARWDNLGFRVVKGASV